MSSKCSQGSANAMKAQCELCKRNAYIVKASESAENCQHELRRNAIERHTSSEATPWSPLGSPDRPFFKKKYQDFLRSHGAPKKITPCQCSGKATWCDRALRP